MFWVKAKEVVSIFGIEHLTGSRRELYFRMKQGRRKGAKETLGEFSCETCYLAFNCACGIFV